MMTRYAFPLCTLFACAGLIVAITACNPPAIPNPPHVPPPPISGAVLPESSADYVCQFTETPPKIDGDTTDDAWKRAAVIDSFTQHWKGEAVKPKHATRARLLWDREYLYFCAEMEDDNLYATVTEHNGAVWENDAFELFFKPAADKPGYFEFEVNPLNTNFDLFIPDRAKGGWVEFRNKHPFKFESKVKARGEINKFDNSAKGWTVEGRLRWVDFAVAGGRPAPGEAWQFALCRVDYHDAKTHDLSTTAKLTKPSFHRHQEYGKITFAKSADRAERPYGIDSRPQWTRSKLVGYPDPPPPYTVEPAFATLKIKQPLHVLDDPATGDLLILQHLGRWAGPAKLLRVKNDRAATEAIEILDGPDELAYGMCLHPDYLKNGYVYVHSNGPLEAPKKFNYVRRYTMDFRTGKLDPKSRLDVIEPFESNGHNGGGIEFGPDGMLYFTTGDTSNDSDTADRGQDLSGMWSAVIRIDVDRPAPGKNYSVPKDNPFVNRIGARPEIWAHGFRNPWRLAFDKVTGDLWVGQNGQDLWEPVYVVKKGTNYGWPVYEGSHPFHAHRRLLDTPLGKPAVEHHHSEARSLTGGIVYHGKRYPDLAGCYIYGDFSTGRIWAAKWDNKAERVTFHKEIAKTTAQINHFAADRNGDIFICDDAGGVLRLVPRPADAVTPPFPQKLSQTGLFADTAKHVPAPDLIPYDVNSPLWSDGAAKERFIALPEGATIDYRDRNGWEFPNGTALVKTFAIDTEAGNPKTRRRLETRIMLKQMNNWDGYTYVWNDDQTDAELAPASGVDRTYSIKDPAAPGGVRQQQWHYPSRAECMVCHSRAANWALGLSELQMNRDYTYPSGVTDNQLRTLEHLGVLRVDAQDHAKKTLRRDAAARGVDPKKVNDWVAAAMTDKLAPQRPAEKASLLTRPPAALTRMPDPADPTADVAARARSYLHANCAICHIDAGGGNASIDLAFTSDMPKTRLLEPVPPANSLGIKDAMFVAPGKPEASVLLKRMQIRGTGQMPPLATYHADPVGVRVVEDWIKSMPAK